MKGTPMKASFVTGPLRDRLKEAMASKPVLAAVAYVANAKDLPLGKGDLLVCDASPAVAEAGSTVKRTLRKLVKDGVSVWSLQDLHAKVVVCGKRAIVGSANWSTTAEKRKIEAGIDTDDTAVVAAATTFVRGLLEYKNVRKVDKAFLSTMPNPVRKEGGEKGGAPAVDRTIRHWLTPSSELPQKPKWLKAWDEFELIHQEGNAFNDDGEASWYLYSSSARNVGRIAGGDTLTVMYQSDDEDTFVYPPRRVLRAVHIEGFVGLLTLEVANEEKRKVPWHKFVAAAPLAGVRKNFTQDSHIEMSAATAQALESLWAPKGKGKRKA